MALQNKNKFSIVVKYILLFAWVYLVTVSCSNVETFDLGRCYSQAEIYVESFSVLGMIGHRLLSTIDFIYYIILYYAVKVSFPLNILTSIMVFFYYVIIDYATKKETKGIKINESILFVILFTTPMIWVVSISRNFTAILFLFIAIISYCKNHKLLSLLFIVIAVFTHFTIIMYAMVLFLCVLLRKIKVSPLVIVSLLLLTFIVGMAIPTALQDVLFRFISDQDTSYNSYIGGASGFYLFYEATNYADKIPMTFALFYSIMLLLLNRKQGAAFWGLLILTLMLWLFMCSMYTLIHRCMMVMPIFWGLNVAKILGSSNKKGKEAIQFVCWVGVASLLLHIYGYRQIYFAGF